MKGDRIESALSELRRLGLKGEIEDHPDCDASERVLYTEPAKDQMVQFGSTVRVYTSTAGPDAVRVPDLRHRPRADAEDELRRLGLTVRYARPVQTDREQENNVLKQKPDPLKPMMPGCSVEITLAIPIPKVQVPNFVGLPRDEALSRLPKFSFGGGLIRGNVSEVENCRAAGRVIEQHPSAGEWVEQGSSVNLVLARCSDSDTPGRGQQQYVFVPSVLNMWMADAKKLLESNGLVGEYQNGNCSDFKISHQDPGAQVRVLRGTHVKLSCSTR